MTEERQGPLTDRAASVFLGWLAACLIAWRITWVTIGGWLPWVLFLAGSLVVPASVVWVALRSHRNVLEVAGEVGRRLRESLRNDVRRLRQRFSRQR